MLLSILNFITNNLNFFTGSYSNNIFPDPLTKEEEDKYRERKKLYKLMYNYSPIYCCNISLNLFNNLPLQSSNVLEYA